MLFADRAPDLALVARCAAAGFYGVMLDTADKSAGALTRHLSEATLARFIADARRRGLLVGLAGSLAAADVPRLLPLRPDYLGFRSALTTGGRNAPLDPGAVARMRALLDDASPSSSATATAGAVSAAPAARQASRRSDDAVEAAIGTLEPPRQPGADETADARADQRRRRRQAAVGQHARRRHFELLQLTAGDVARQTRAKCARARPMASRPTMRARRARALGHGLAAAIGGGVLVGVRRQLAGQAIDVGHGREKLGHHAAARAVDSTCRTTAMTGVRTTPR